MGQQIIYALNTTVVEDVAGAGPGPLTGRARQNAGEKG